jgi:hypothetical protein
MLAGTASPWQNMCCAIVRPLPVTWLPAFGLWRMKSIFVGYWNNCIIVGTLLYCPSRLGVARPSDFVAGVRATFLCGSLLGRCDRLGKQWCRISC